MSEARIHDLVDQMSLEEQVSLLSGADAWTIPAITRLGLGRLKVTDGPNGARGEDFVGGTPSAAYPVGIALGASWDVELLHEIGADLSREVKARGAHMSLAPTVNLQRSVTNGRNFECYSEDPVLTAELAVAYIKGLQENGVAATVKHFVGNESEIERTTINSIIDERALRELYLVPFEWAVKRAGTWGIMSSYNKLNGAYTSESEWLLTEVLRKQWHYDGAVMSDWWGSHSTAPTINAGLDLEMPGPPRDRGEKLIAAVRDGSVAASAVRERALNMLRLMERTGALDQAALTPERADDRPETRALIRRAGAEGTVLLKNEGVLPLAGSGRIAVIGPNVKVARAMGGGSSQLNAYYTTTPWDGLVAALGAERLTYAVGATNDLYEPLFTGNLEAEFYDSDDLSGPVVGRMTNPGGILLIFNSAADGVSDPRTWSARIKSTFTPEVSGTYRVGLVSLGVAKAYVDGKLIADSWTKWKRSTPFFEEGGDEVTGDLVLEAGRSYAVTIEFARRPFHVLDIPGIRIGIGRPLGSAEIAEAVATARAAETAIVFVGRTGEWDSEGADLPHIELPGRQNELVAAVAAANPRTIVVLQTGGPVEMPWLGQVAGVIAAWYTGQEVGNAIADVLTGAAEPGGRLPQSFPVRWRDNPTQSQDPEVYPGHDGRVRYEEGVFIGYRHYDRGGIATLFPFGFGLSYTSFSLGNLSIDAGRFESEGRVSVSLDVANTGARAGSEVVQLYVGDPEASVPRPPKELKAFAKVHLRPGESRRLTVELEPRDFAYFDVDRKAWTVEPGQFKLLVGTSATEIKFAETISRLEGMSLPV
ncbi:MAG: glycoside hydrolase family 3 C-terminal domain-containing protein [Devosia sp.]